MSYTCASSPFFSSSTFTLIFRPCFTPAVFCLMFIQLWRIWKLPTGFRGGWPPRGRPRLCYITGCCSKKVGFRYFFEETEKKGDIYGPKCWIDLIFNLRVTLDFFFFWNCKVQNCPKSLGLNRHLCISTYSDVTLTPTDGRWRWTFNQLSLTSFSQCF